MGTKTLLVIALLLCGGLLLAWSNPSAREYQRYQEALLDQAFERIQASPQHRKDGVLAQLAQPKQRRFIKSLVRSQTSRTDLGLCSLYETRVLSARIQVLGIGGRFIPLTDPEEALREIETTALGGKP